MGFIDLAVHNPIVLTIDGVNFAYEIDSHGAANYIFDDHGFEAEFDRLEVTSVSLCRFRFKTPTLLVSFTLN